MIKENKRVIQMKLKELRAILKTQRHQKALAIPQKQFRSEKLKNSYNILQIISSYNPNNSNVFTKVRESRKL